MSKNAFLVTKFQKSSSVDGGSSLQRPLILDFSDLKLRDLIKFVFQTDYDEIKL